MFAIKIKSALNMWIGCFIIMSSSVSSENDSSTLDWARFEAEVGPQLRNLPEVPKDFPKTRFNWFDWTHAFEKDRACKGTEYVSCKTYDFTYGGRDYRFYRRPLANWFRAFSVCCAIGGFLAFPRSTDEANHFTEKIHSVQPSVTFDRVAPWLGMHDILQTGTFQRFTKQGHSDFDEGASTLKWGPGYPKSTYNEASCVWSTIEPRTQNTIENHPCTTEKTFMCEINL